MFPSIIIEHLCKEHSDHCPIIINTTGKDSRGKRPFFFLETWTTEKSCNQIVQAAWNMDIKRRLANHKMSHSLEFTTITLQKWNKEVLGFAQN